MHLKIVLLSRGLKLSNSKPGCRAQLFTSFWNRYQQLLSDIELIQTSALISFVVPRLTPVSLLESECGHGIVTLLGDTRKRPSSLLQSMFHTHCQRVTLLRFFFSARLKENVITRLTRRRYASKSRLNTVQTLADF